MDTSCNNSFIVFSSTNTGMGKFIRHITHNTYNHTSICLDGKFYELYSFARKHINSPFCGGLVVETPARYITDGKDVMVKVCRIDPKVFSPDTMNERLEKIFSQKDSFIYNTYGAIVSPLRIKLCPYHSFTCVEFVSYILGIKKPMYSVKQLEKIFDKYKIYEGSYKKLIERYSDNATFPKDDYNTRLTKRAVLLGTARQFYDSAKRSLGRYPK